MSFYEQLEKLCEKNNVKPSNLIESLGMSKGTMSNWKKGGVPNADAVVRFAKHFGVSTDYLLLGTDIPNTNLNLEDIEWIKLIHRLPKPKRNEFKARIEGYLECYDESVAADKSLRKTGTDNMGK